ncbi:hypothetical protein HDU96_003025 [Phlyctochytrium bullatum]|nr:hypothetical protein HDU96_003025 [Phlyctochytrium bullatum]
MKSAAKAIVVKEEDGLKLHRFIRKRFPLEVPSKSQAHDAFKHNQVLINGEVRSETSTVKEGDTVSLLRSVHEAIRKKETSIDIKMHYADADFCAASKPSGMATHRGASSLATALPHHLNTPNHPVHPLYTLDNSSTGLVLFTRPPHHRRPTSPLSLTICAIVHGRLAAPTGGPIEPGQELVMEEPLPTAGAAGATRPARTVVTVVRVGRSRNTADGWLTELDARIEADLDAAAAEPEPVAYQVRWHLQSLGFPVVGIAGNCKPHRSLAGRGTLLAITSIRFIHPITHTPVTITDPEPAKFSTFFDREDRAFRTRVQDDQRQLATAPTDSPTPDASDPPSFKNPAYALGHTTFHNLLIHVTPAVMIPRDSSQALVTAALSHHPPHRKPKPNPPPPPPPSSTSAPVPALAVAQRNLTHHGLDHRAVLVETAFRDVGAVKEKLISPVAMVVGNPPYLRRTHRVFGTCDGERLREEPELALFGGEKGLDCYAMIRDGLLACEPHAATFFAPRCVLILEVGNGMADQVKAVFTSSPPSASDTVHAAAMPWRFVEVLRDRRGLERGVVFVREQK